MQPSSLLGTGAVQGMSSVTACLSSSQVGFQVQPMHNQQQHQHQHQQQQQQQHFPSQFEQTNQPHMDDFIEQMFSMPSWPEVGGGKAPWEFNNGAPNNNSNQNLHGNSQKLFTMSLLPNEGHARENLQYSSYDESILASRLSQHQLGSNNSVMNSSGINETDTSPGRSMVLQLSTGNATHLLASMANPSRGTTVMTRSPSSAGSDGGMLPLPLSLGQGKQEEIEATFKPANNARDSNPGGLFTAFVGSTRAVRPAGPNFHPQTGQVAMQSYGGMSQPQHQQPHPPPNAVGATPARPRVRARRGQATDPHSIAERLRRERIAERMKSLQELVPNSNKTDKASMLDEIIDYVKFLQLQVKVLSMSRLGGAGAVAPLVADIPSEVSNNPQVGRTNESQSSSQDGLALTERQVAKLMEEDMGSAMQYLQSKGLCLMPISLASAISSSGSRSQSTATNTSLQGLLVSNVSDRQLLEPTNSALSASSMSIQPAISSPGSEITEADNNNVKNGARNPKDSREANSIAKSNGLGPNLSKKGEE